MSITVTYNILFEVKILHHYFLNKGLDNFERMDESAKAEMMLKYDVREFFDIRPTAECQKNLDRHHCIFKATSTGIIVGMKAEPDGLNPLKCKPWPELDDELLFTFLVNLNEPNLLNYTALPLTGNSSQLYVFQNLTGPRAKAYPSLCTTPPAYVAGPDYLPGDMVTDNPENPATLFTAMHKTSSLTANSKEWLAEERGDGYPVSYANLNDRHPVVRERMVYRVKTAGVKPTVVVKSASGTTVTPKTTLVPVDLQPGEFQSIQIELGGLPEGFYSLHAESDDHTYKDEVAFFLLQQRQTPFGILQLQVKSDTTAYNMLDPEGFLLSPTYELRLRNRATHWRYVGKNFNASSITHSSLPLTRFGFIKQVKVTDKDGNEVDDLPNPAVAMIKAEALSIAEEKNFYSEIYIH